MTTSTRCNVKKLVRWSIVSVREANGAPPLAQGDDLIQDTLSEDEFAKAKTYLKGSFALGLDTSNRIASQLVQMQLDNLGIDYIERRPALIDAVTLDDARRVAKRLLDPGLLVTVVGRPEGVSSTHGGVAASPSAVAKPGQSPASRE